MTLVVADTSPLNYLVLLGHAELLPRLFNRVVIYAHRVDTPRHVSVRDWFESEVNGLAAFGMAELVLSNTGVSGSPSTATLRVFPA
ncbi:MAG: hypothetical protein ACC628_24885 [Pirellulaceae bacterium]